MFLLVKIRFVFILYLIYIKKTVAQNIIQNLVNNRRSICGLITISCMSCAIHKFIVQMRTVNKTYVSPAYRLPSSLLFSRSCCFSFPAEILFPKFANNQHKGNSAILFCTIYAMAFSLKAIFSFVVIQQIITRTHTSPNITTPTFSSTSPMHKSQIYRTIPSRQRQPNYLRQCGSNRARGTRWENFNYHTSGMEAIEE